MLGFIIFSSTFQLVVIYCIGIPIGLIVSYALGLGIRKEVLKVDVENDDFIGKLANLVIGVILIFLSAIFYAGCDRLFGG